MKNKTKQKQTEKVDSYQNDNDYTINDKLGLNRKKKLKKVK